MSTPAAAHTQNLNLGLPPNSSADYERDYDHNFRIVDFITQNKSNVVVSGLAVTAGAGLTVNWAAGSATVNGTTYTIGASSGSATDNTADANIHLPNYIFVNNSGAVTISTSLPTTEYTPLAIVFTNAGSISKVVDGRKITSASDTITNMPAGAYTVTAAQCTGRTTLTNAGAGASSVTPTLPVGAANYVILFNHVDSGNLVIDPNGIEELYVDGVSLGAGVALTSTKQGAKYTCVWNSSGGWWEVNYYNTKVTAQSVLASDLSHTATYGSFDSTTVSVTVRVGASKKAVISMFASFQNSGINDSNYFRINRDSATDPEYILLGSIGQDVAYERTQFSGFHEFSNLSAGNHTFLLEWAGSGGTRVCSASSSPQLDKMVLRGESW